MESDKYFGNDKLEFRQIVLGHIKRILEISSHELHDSTQHVNHGSHTDIIVKEDTRKSYYQAIENLAYVLVPYFDKEMEEVYWKCEEVLTGFDLDIIEKFKKRYARISEKLGDGRNIDRDFVLSMRIKYAKKLFVELNLLLRRVDYLKSAIYGEDSGEEVVEDVEEKE